MLVVKAEAPTRIDLAGGTLDINPLYHVLDGPQTVNIGISLTAKVEVESSRDRTIHLRSHDQDLFVAGLYSELVLDQRLPLLSLILKNFWQESWGGVRVETRCQSPAGAGLGGSSCLAVTMAYALNTLANELKVSEKLAEKELIQKVQNIETRLIKCPTGCQDYWGAVRGRVNILSFDCGGVSIETISPEYVDYLDERLIICFSGKSRDSGINNWSIFKEVFDGDLILLDKLNEIGRLSMGVARAIKDNDWATALKISHDEWLLRKSLWPEIETKETKAIDRSTRSSGAMFSRVCGAGGGGVMAIFVPPNKRQQVIQAAIEAGGTVLDSHVSRSGLSISIERG